MHDCFRVIARKDGDRVRLYSRPGNDLTYRFPLIVEALARRRSRSCIIDGEAVACGDDGRRVGALSLRIGIGGNISAWFDAVVCDGDMVI
jgi:ATP-dependent DNA ligase